VLLDGIKSLKSLTRFSNELARSSIVALDAALRDRMVLDVAARRQQLGVARVPRGRTRPARRHPEIAAGSSDIPARSPTRPSTSRATEQRDGSLDDVGGVRKKMLKLTYLPQWYPLRRPLVRRRW